MACIATRLMSSGAAKSGKPCERLTAPYFIASRVISRMTDSVNELALRETRLDVAGTGELIRLTTGEHGLAQIRIKELRSGLIIPFALISVYLCESVANCLDVQISVDRQSIARRARAIHWEPVANNFHRQRSLLGCCRSFRKTNRA